MSLHPAQLRKPTDRSLPGQHVLAPPILPCAQGVGTSHSWSAEALAAAAAAAAQFVEAGLAGHAAAAPEHAAVPCACRLRAGSKAHGWHHWPRVAARAWGQHLRGCTGQVPGQAYGRLSAQPG